MNRLILSLCNYGNTNQPSNFTLIYFFNSECIRVDRFCEIANNADEDDQDDAIEQLSELLSKSHNSLKTLYECSHPNLDELVNISKTLGVGARLTGICYDKKSLIYISQSLVIKNVLFQVFRNRFLMFKIFKLS